MENNLLGKVTFLLKYSKGHALQVPSLRPNIGALRKPGILIYEQENPGSSSLNMVKTQRIWVSISLYKMCIIPILQDLYDN